MLLPCAAFSGGCNLKENRMSVYKRGKGTHWHYYFRVRGVRYRGSIPEARTKQQAEQAESKIKQGIFEKRFEVEQKGAELFSDFLDDVYLPWSKVNKKSSDDYVFVSPKDSNERQREVKKGFHTACRLTGIEGLIWKDVRATFGTRLAEAGCDAFTIAQLLGHSDVRVTMRYVR